MTHNTARSNDAAPLRAASTDTDRIALVDQLWKLKKHWQEHTGSHIPLNVLIKEVDYRRDVLDGAIRSGKPALEDLARRIRVIEERIGEISSITNTPAPAAPSRLVLGSMALALVGMIVLTGALIYWSANQQARTLLPAQNPMIAFRLHGSNTIGEELAPALLQAFFESQGALEVLVSGSAVPVEKQVQFVLPEHDLFPAAVQVHAHGSSTSFRDLAAARADMGMSSRPVKQAEIEALRAQYGDLSALGSEHVIALDGLAVIVNPANPLRELTKSQVADIFSGRIRDWSALGGAPLPINIHARDDNSGTYDTFKSLVLKPNGVTLDERARRYESSTELSDQVAADPGGIGFIGLPYVRNAVALGVAESRQTPAIVPTEFTISTEDYPLSRRLYFYVPATTSNRMIRDFVQFTLSDAGQAVVENTGLIAQRIRAEPARIRAGATPRFEQATANAQQLSVNLRFDPASGRLDNKGVQDIERIVAFMKENRQRELMLLGFTDSSGNPAADLERSRSDAGILAQMFIARGLYPALVDGFGAALPVAANDSDAGRRKNRRVEVWIR